MLITSSAIVLKIGSFSGFLLKTYEPYSSAEASTVKEGKGNLKGGSQAKQPGQACKAESRPLEQHKQEERARVCVRDPTDGRTEHALLVYVCARAQAREINPRLVPSDLSVCSFSGRPAGLDLSSCFGCRHASR